MAQKGPIEPNSKSLSQGDTLERVEKFGGPTTPFRGQKVKKGASTCLYFSLINFYEFFKTPSQKLRISALWYVVHESPTIKHSTPQGSSPVINVNSKSNCKYNPIYNLFNGDWIVTLWTLGGSTPNSHQPLVTGPSGRRNSFKTLWPWLGVKRSKKGLCVHQAATRLVGEWDVSRSEKTGRRSSRFGILVK